MKNKIVLNIVLVYFIVVSIVLVMQLYSGNKSTETPMNETVRLADKLNNSVVLCKDSPVMLVNKRQMIIGGSNINVVPIRYNGCFYAPLSFFETAFGAAVEEDFDKKQATLRMNNTAVVFSAAQAQVISSSAEDKRDLEDPVIFRNTYAYIPLNAFCDIFGREMFEYNENMLILSPAEENVDFDPAAEAELLAEIEQQVSNLPLVLSENNLRKLIGARSVFFGTGSDSGGMQVSAAKAEKMVIDDSESEKLAPIGDRVFAICGGKLVCGSSTDNTFATVELCEGFVPETLTVYDGRLFITGTGENAEMPVVEQTFDADPEQQETRSEGKVIVPGKKFILLCCEIGEDAQPVIKRWFYCDGDVVKKQLFENSLCIAVRKNAGELAEDDVYKTPSYCDLNKRTQAKFDEIKYMPQMLDKAFTAIYRFDLADLTKKADADFFLGVGEDFTLAQNSVIFSAQGSMPSENGTVSNKLTNLYKLNLINGGYNHEYIDGTLVSLNRIAEYGGYAALAEKNGKSVMYMLNGSLENDSRLELSADGLANVSSADGNIYFIDASKENMIIASLSQVYVDDEKSGEPRTVIQAQEKTAMALDGVEYIRPYETAVIGLGKNKELNNAEISMWSIKDSAVKTAGDVIGDAGTAIKPIETKNIAEGEMLFDLSLFVNGENGAVEKYNGVYIYNISENNTPVFKGRITHNQNEETGIIITDAAYLNGKYFTLSQNVFAVNEDSADMTELNRYTA